MSHRRKLEDKRRLKKLYEETKNGYGAGAWYDDRKDRFIRYSCNSAWLKKYCSKMTRTKIKRIPLDKDFLFSRGIYKRLYDYQWELF